MKVRLADLQDAIKNPSAFVRAKGRLRTGFGRSRYLTLRNVALDFHNQHDLALSEASLESKLTNNFKVTRGNYAYIKQLREYAKQFASLGTSVAKVRNNVKITLPDEYVDFQITGQVTRLDINPQGGYCAWLFVNRTADWDEELRFPLLQLACATQLNVEIEEVVPGVYDFSTGSYTPLVHSKRKVQRARRQLMQFLDELKNLS